MTATSKPSIQGKAITTQTAGRFGEHMIQAELERRGWSTCNLNTDHPNAPGYDILAWKDGATVTIRAKTVRPQRRSGHEMPVFHVAKGKPPSAGGIGASDFTVLVFMGREHGGDQFYVVPTRTLRQTMAARWNHYYASLTKGRPKVDNGQLTLYMGPAPKGEDRPGWNLTVKWARYCNAWDALAGGASPVAA